MAKIFCNGKTLAKSLDLTSQDVSGWLRHLKEASEQVEGLRYDQVGKGWVIELDDSHATMIRVACKQYLAAIAAQRASRKATYTAPPRDPLAGAQLGSQIEQLSEEIRQLRGLLWRLNKAAPVVLPVPVPASTLAD